MNKYILAVRKSILNKNWYAALALAMTLPDICGLLEYPELKDASKKRYVNWFNKYMLEKYTCDYDDDNISSTCLSGNDCYALRCSFLHQGEDIITSQRARQALDSFHFICPQTNKSIIHMLQKNSTLLLQVDIFCEDMCLGVEEWIKYIKLNKPQVQERFSILLEIYDATDNVLSF